MSIGWVVVGGVLGLLTALNAYLTWANRRRVEHDEVQAEADES